MSDFPAPKRGGKKPGNFREERHFARECALQFLYQADQQNDWGNVARNLALLRRQVADFEDAPTGTGFERAWKYAEGLIRGVVENRDELDAIITAASTNWSVDRMSVVDRNILRLAACELKLEKAPPKVALNEGVELAKSFGDKDSRSFVNGVLDRIHRDSAKKQ